ncbi:translation initiation factor IF-2 [Patescibacteria group bacterium]
MPKPKKKKKENKDLQTRPPVVVILGHVDHGKTSILDYIRKTKIAEKESGGITQHIGAYQIEYQNKKITFIDTPGHEAFSAMRGRSVRLADIAILVIAAEESIKPQTKEAIQHIKKIGIPVIIAINKIDKKEADPEKIKSELVKYDITVESRNGDIPCINISARTGQGINELLEMINLVSEMEELKNEINEPASGIIIESYQDQQRGPTATLLIRKGVLNKRDIIATDSAFGRIKTMEDFQLKPIEKAYSSTPAIVIGFNKVPKVGERFKLFKDLNEAEAEVNRKIEKNASEDKTEILEIDQNKKVLNIILKSDVRGSLEAIKESLKNIPCEEVILRFIKTDVGDINESDIKTASMSQSTIIGFRIKNSHAMQEMSRQKKVKLFTFDIIYELIQKIRELLSQMLEPEIIKNEIGRLKILAVFKTNKDRQIVGGKVTSGQAKKGALINIIRDGEIISQGKLIQLQRDKKETDEVSRDQECGIMIQSQLPIEKGDILEFYSEEKKRREI